MLCKSSLAPSINRWRKAAGASLWLLLAPSIGSLHPKIYTKDSSPVYGMPSFCYARQPATSRRAGYASLPMHEVSPSLGDGGLKRHDRPWTKTHTNFVSWIQLAHLLEVVMMALL